MPLDYRRPETEGQPVRLPGVRFTVRRVMVAVAIVAVALATERFLAHLAVEFVIERHSDGTWEYIEGEAVTVWVVLNALLSIPIGFGAAAIRAVRGAHGAVESRNG
jgi:hypothetical protein